MRLREAEAMRRRVLRVLPDATVDIISSPTNHHDLSVRCYRVGINLVFCTVDDVVEALEEATGVRPMPDYMIATLEHWKQSQRDLGLRLTSKERE